MAVTAPQILLLIATVLTSGEGPTQSGSLAFIDTSFGNASPLFWEIDQEGVVQIYLVYDQERSSPNRANGHWHFLLEAEAGTRLTLVLNNLQNVWNGKPGVPVSDRTTCKISEDGRVWRTVDTEIVDSDRLQIKVEMRTDRLYVAHLEPYRVSDLERLLAAIRGDPRVDISVIGRTVRGRDLEMVRIGRPDAPRSVLLRARAHSWESGGSWVVQGLVKSLLRDGPRNERYLREYAIYILPMANKDGVANGRTRFNLRGKDLNRDWDRPADPDLAPENHALERWLERMVDAGKKPDLAIDLHNDQGGQIHVSRPDIDLEAYLRRVDRYERLMRQHTWFTEGRTGGSFRNPGTFGEGLLERYGITALVQELNANWVAGLEDHASGKNWELLGGQYRRVFSEFLAPIGQ